MTPEEFVIRYVIAFMRGALSQAIEMGTELDEFDAIIGQRDMPLVILNGLRKHTAC